MEYNGKDEAKELKRIDVSVIGYLRVFYYYKKSNLAAIVPEDDPCTVFIWDCATNEKVLQYSVVCAVLSVRIIFSKLIVCMRENIIIFTIEKNARKLKVLDTGNNPKGLLSITPSESTDWQIMAFPYVHPGQIRIQDLRNFKNEEDQIIKAHHSEISFISLDQDGGLMATASVKGTVIRVFNTQSKTLLAEVRRGIEFADIFCINFCPKSEFLLVSSNRGTVHVFSLQDAVDQSNEPASWFDFLRSYPRSFATVKVATEMKNIVFLDSNTDMFVVCHDGGIHKFCFRKEGKWEFKGSGYLK